MSHLLKIKEFLDKHPKAIFVIDNTSGETFLRIKQEDNISEVNVHGVGLFDQLDINVDALLDAAKQFDL